MDAMMTAATTEASSPEELACAALTLARAFGAGATMWCVAPEWPAHGDHVAVEFVHPVIVGKRALPAVHLSCKDVVGTLRLLARAGDILLVIGSTAGGQLHSLLRRAEAWGMTRLWICVGQVGEALGEHVISLPVRDPETAARNGDVVVMYHLLWELTHVVFEHPGLLQPPRVQPDVCITCADEAKIAEVRRLVGEDHVEVICGGAIEQVEVSLVGPLEPGDLVLVHAGVAITVLDDDHREEASGHEL